MIIGYCQKLLSQPDKIYDYVGCLFPEGFVSADQNDLFNREQIDMVYHPGLAHGLTNGRVFGMMDPSTD